MGEINHNGDNPENKSPSTETKQPEAAKASDGDKEKLTPKENDSSKTNKENNDNEQAEKSSHPKLEAKDDNHPKKTESNEPQKVEGDQPKKNEGDQPKKNEGDQPKKNEGDQPKKNEGDQPKKNEGDQPKKNEGDQPKKDEGDQPKKDEGDQTKKNEGDQPKKDEGDQTKKNEGDQPKKGEGDQPKKDEGDQTKKNEGDQPKKDEGDQPKKDEGDQPKEQNPEKNKQPVENTDNSNKDINPQNLPVLSKRAPLRSDLPAEATTDKKIGDYPIKAVNWNEAGGDPKKVDMDNLDRNGKPHDISHFADPESAKNFKDHEQLQPGTYYRYGGPDGNYITKREPGQSLDDLYSGLAMPYEHDPSKWSVVDVKEPLDNVYAGEVAPQDSFKDYGGQGGGWQAELPHALWEYPSDKVTMRPLLKEEKW